MAETNVQPLRRSDEPKSFRLAPHNVEAEQALLGAILVNNEAFYRVSDFLAPEHFYEPIHREIYEISGKIIRAGKAATPITVKTFLPDNLVADVTMPQYLARLAAEATTVINAADYGQSIYDLAIRRNLIQIGEEMTSTAYNSEVEETAHKQIEEAEKQLFDLAEKGRYDGGFQPFNEALKDAITMAGEAYSRDGTLSGMATGLTDLDRMMGGLQKSDLDHHRRPPGHGEDLARDQHRASTSRRSWKGEITPDGHRKTVDGGQVGFFSLEMSAEQLATRILADEAEISSSDIRRGNIHESQFARLVDASNVMSTDPALHRRHRRPLDQPARGAGPAPQAAEGARPPHHRLHPAALGLVAQGQREPRAGNDRDHHHAQGAGQGARGADHRARPAQPRRSKAATTSIRSSPTCANPARSSRTPTWCSSSIARSTTSRTRSPGKARPSTWRGRGRWRRCTAAPK